MYIRLDNGYYLYIKNRLLFIAVVSIVLLTVAELLPWAIWGDQINLLGICTIQLPVFILGSWLYHSLVTDRMNSKKIKTTR